LSSYCIPEPQEISDAKEHTAKDDNATEKDHPMTRTDPRTKGDPGAKKQDTAQRYTEDLSSPTDPSGCLIHEPYRGKRKYVWDRVKRMTSIIVRSATL